MQFWKAADPVRTQEMIALARQKAAVCSSFRADDEDEQVDDVAVSCRNCSYRRWTADSFECRLDAF